MFWAKRKEDKALVFQNEQVTLLTRFKEELTLASDRGHLLAIERVEECLADLAGKNSSLLKLVLRSKWLIREIGSMIYDGSLVLNQQEGEIWRQIKDCQASYDRFGHGVGLGL